MKKEIEINEWIESYLNGDLSSGETEHFLKRLNEDPILKREVEKHRQFRELIIDGAYVRVKNELKGIHAKKIKLSRNIRRITGFGTAGLIVGLVILLVFTHNHSTHVPFNTSADSLAKKASSGTSVGKTEKKPSVSKATGNVIQPESRTTAEVNPGSKKSNGTSALSVYPKMGNNSTDLKSYEDIALNNIRSSPSGIRNDVTPPGRDIPNKPADNVITNCRKVKFKAEITSHESCNNKATGSLKISRGSISGGKSPYKFSLNMSTFYDTLEFSSLYSGNYPVYVKDSNNCIGLAGIAQIGALDCTYQAVFAPLNGETWTVPIKVGNEGTLRIISKSGALVLVLKFSGYDNPEWNGETITGQQLPMGIYQFEISYADGNKFTGNVTIVK